MNITLCKVYDGEVMEVEEENRSEDRRMSSSSPNLFSFVREVNNIYCVSLIYLPPFTKVVPFDEAVTRRMVMSYGRPQPYH
jgi:hypothetical protein